MLRQKPELPTPRQYNQARGAWEDAVTKYAQTGAAYNQAGEEWRKARIELFQAEEAYSEAHFATFMSDKVRDQIATEEPPPC